MNRAAVHPLLPEARCARRRIPAALYTLLTAAAVGLGACGGEPPAPGPGVASEGVPVASPAAAIARTPAPAGATVSIVEPADGAVVASPVTVAFAIEGMSVAPAGTFDPATGHHHLLIDVDLPALDQPIPADERHIHFGKGQTEAQVELAPGTHRLQLLLGDGNHVPHDPPVVSVPVTITVE